MKSKKQNTTKGPGAAKTDGLVCEAAPAGAPDPGPVLNFSGIKISLADIACDEIRGIVYEQLSLLLKRSSVARAVLLQLRAHEDPVPSGVALAVIAAQLATTADNLTVRVLMERARNRFFRTLFPEEVLRGTLVKRFTQWLSANPAIKSLWDMCRSYRNACVEEIATTGGSPTVLDAILIQACEARRQIDVADGKTDKDGRHTVVAYAFPDGVRVLRGNLDVLRATETATVVDIRSELQGEVDAFKKDTAPKTPAPPEESDEALQEIDVVPPSALN